MSEMLASHPSRPDKQTIEGIEMEMARLDYESREMQTNAHQDQYRQLQRSLDLRLSLAAPKPIAKIPSETLSDIFRACLTERESWEYWSNNRIKALVLLSSVCGQWREVALATGDLWSLIHVDEDYLPPVELLQTWILRAGTHPLTYIVKWEDGPAFSNKRDIIFEILLDHLGMAREVDFVLGDRHLMQLAKLVGPFPRLQRLSLRQADYHETPISLHAFQNAPALIEGCLYNIPRMHCPLPWQQLQVCEIGRQAIEDCLYLLQQCASVVDFSVESPMLPLDHTHFSPTEKVICSTLKILRIFCEEDVFTPFLDSITGPNLVSLELNNYCSGADHEEFENLAASTVSFLARSSCDLRELMVHWLPFTRDEYNNVLCRVPNLEKLSIDELGLKVRGLEPHLVKSLTRSPNGDSALGTPLLVPRLREIHLDSDWDFLSDQEFVEFVSSRLPPANYIPDDAHSITQLESVDVSRKRSFGQGVMRQLSGWKAKGLKVSVLGRSSKRRGGRV